MTDDPFGNEIPREAVEREEDYYMATKWTPGPWQADVRTGCLAVYAGPKRNCLSGSSRDAIVYQDGRGVPIAVGSYPETTDEQEANAHLIAAAPEMYAVLKDLVEGGWIKGETGLASVVRSALAKAEGR